MNRAWEFGSGEVEAGEPEIQDHETIKTAQPVKTLVPRLADSCHSGSFPHGLVHLNWVDVCILIFCFALFYNFA